MKLLQIIGSLFQKLYDNFWGVVEQQREIISEAKEKDEKLMVRLDRVNPDNYVTINYKGFDLTMRKEEIPTWSALGREQKRGYVEKVKSKIKKGHLVYKQFGTVKLLVDPKQVLNPVNEL